MTARIPILSLWALAHSNPTDEQAEALIARLADPHTRAVARAEWRELQAASVQTIESEAYAR